MRIYLLEILQRLYESPERFKLKSDTTNNPSWFYSSSQLSTHRTVEVLSYTRDAKGITSKRFYGFTHTKMCKTVELNLLHDSTYSKEASYGHPK